MSTSSGKRDENKTTHNSYCCKRYSFLFKPMKFRSPKYSAGLNVGSSFWNTASEQPGYLACISQCSLEKHTWRKICDHQDRPWSQVCRGAGPSGRSEARSSGHCVSPCQEARESALVTENPKSKAKICSRKETEARLACLFPFLFHSGHQSGGWCDSQQGGASALGETLQPHPALCRVSLRQDTWHSSEPSQSDSQTQNIFVFKRYFILKIFGGEMIKFLTSLVFVYCKISLTLVQFEEYFYHLVEIIL